MREHPKSKPRCVMTSLSSKEDQKRPQSHNCAMTNETNRDTPNSLKSKLFLWHKEDQRMVMPHYGRHFLPYVRGLSPKQ
ncbi:hypothetical protein F8M41_010276 [Gigaspora margarita]|uniref:Uncharacterized protein n=1 Tax=Gigaspora margarita TaxID=4874 RepID=A0A8H3X164_GIGMA|nr:hypothetical protein F8M41_010276 [Gigaspora margarita]